MVEKIPYSILVVAYNEGVRNSLIHNLLALGVAAIPCTSFCEAEDIALGGIFNGVLVDLQTIIKAKAEEKVVACSLTGFFPTLRVRAVGSLVVPMAMPGDAKQDSTLQDFIHKTCASFSPRRLRNCRRRDVVLPVLLDRLQPDTRGFTLNVSWGGAFIVVNHPERYAVNTELSLWFQDLDLETPVTVQWIRPWGLRFIPGLGLEFKQIDDHLSDNLENLLNHDMQNARDRMVAR